MSFDTFLLLENALTSLFPLLTALAAGGLLFGFFRSCAATKAAKPDKLRELAAFLSFCSAILKLLLLFGNAGMFLYAWCNPFIENDLIFFGAVTEYLWLQIPVGLLVLSVSILELKSAWGLLTGQPHCHGRLIFCWLITLATAGFLFSHDQPFLYLIPLFAITWLVFRNLIFDRNRPKPDL